MRNPYESDSIFSPAEEGGTLSEAEQATEADLVSMVIHHMFQEREGSLSIDELDKNEGIIQESLERMIREDSDFFRHYRQNPQKVFEKIESELKRGGKIKIEE